MLKWIEATGKNEDAAIQNALEQLGLDRDSVSVEVLERAKSGFFGLGGNPATVKVTYEAPDEAPPAQEPVPQPAPAAPQPETPAAPKRRAPKGSHQPEQGAQTAPPAEKPVPEAPPAPHPAEEAAPEAAQPAAAIQDPPLEGAELEQRVQGFLLGLLEHMGVSAQVKVQPQGERGVQVTLEGEKLGSLIGHRGDTLDAIQQLTNYAVNRGRSHRVRIHVDAENYRARREESLQRLATKVAGKVVKYRRNITLEPMNAYERHVIHETLQDYPDIVTYSTGAEPNRRTVIAFSRGKHAY